MTKNKAVDFMITKIIEIERERISSHLEPTKNKNDAVNKILDVLDEVEIRDEN